jgi:hypothetical protein
VGRALLLLTRLLGELGWTEGRVVDLDEHHR